jgi:hypothetical protein
MIPLATGIVTMTSDTLVQRLRTLTGQRFSYLGDHWRLVEVLGQEDALVLTPLSVTTTPVQTNQYGQPTRRARQTLTLPLSAPDGAGYSEEVLELLAGKIAD